MYKGKGLFFGCIITLAVTTVAFLGCTANVTPANNDNGEGSGDNDNGDNTLGDPVAGEAFYVANNCAACHCADAGGGCAANAPSIVGEESDEIFGLLSGAEEHPGGTVAGVTQADADDLAAWLATQ